MKAKTRAARKPSAARVRKKLDASLAQLEHVELVRRIDEEYAYLFKHALTQDAAYQSLLIKERRALHRRVAESYEQLYPRQLDEYAALLAHHYAQTGDDAKVVEYATRAGDVAARIYAFTEARQYYEQALQALERLLVTPETQARKVDIIIKQVGVSWSAETPEQNLARLADAEASAQALAHDDRHRARLAYVYYWMGRIHTYRGASQQSLPYYEQVLTLAGDSGNDELLGFSFTTIGRTMFAQGQFGKAIPNLVRARAPLERVGNWQEWVIATSILGVCLAAQGRYADALVERGRANERANGLNDPTSIAAARIIGAWACVLGGELARALEDTSVGLSAAQQAGSRLQLYMGYGCTAWAESRSGKHESARANMSQAKTILQSMGGHLVFSDWFAAMEADIELNAGRVQEALALSEQAVRYAQSVSGVFAEGIAQRVWGQALARLDPLQQEATDTHLAASLRAFETGECKVEAARTHVAWGKLLRARGDDAGAGAHFEIAAAQFDASGLERELEETRALIGGMIIHG